MMVGMDEEQGGSILSLRATGKKKRRLTWYLTEVSDHRMKSWEADLAGLWGLKIVERVKWLEESKQEDGG